MKIALLSFWASLLVLFSYKARAQQYAMSQSPLSFQENKGQIHDQHHQPRPDIDARLGQGEFQVFVGKKGLHYQWTHATDATKERLKQVQKTVADPEPYTTTVARVDVVLLGANPNARLRKENKRPEYYTYYNVKQAPEGLTAFNYDKMVYENIYPNIDWVVYTQNGRMKYDFIVRPGGKVTDIRIQYKGATQLALQESGDVTVSSPLGTLTESAPYSYQDDGKEVASHYQVQNDVLTFAVGAYSGTLTIDPSVDWASYFGEVGAIWVSGEGMKVDNEGNVYVNGNAAMTQNMATQGAFLVTPNNIQSGYLAKFTAKGTLAWCTYYGGDANVSSGTTAGGIVIDTAGNITVSGSTALVSFGIVTQGAYQTTFGGGAGDIFMMQFTPDGQRRWGTFLGGEGQEWSFSLATYENSIYIGGTTGSKTNITTAGSYKPVLGGNSGTATFLAKMNLAGTQMEWSTYFDENATSTMAIALDPAGNVYMQGGTYTKTGLATPGAFQQQHNTAPGTEFHCGTITKFTKQGQLSWATFWGGEDNFDGFATGAAIAVDKNYQVYLATSTASKQYMATAGSYQDTYYGGDNDICLMRLDSAGKRIWATYIGGEGFDYPTSIDFDEHGDLWFGAFTGSTQNMSTPEGLRVNYGGGVYDCFFAKYDSLGKKKWGSYYGGTGMEQFSKLEYYKGYLYFGGSTNSLDSLSIATPGAHKTSYPGELALSSMVGRYCFTYTPTSGITGPQEVCSGGEFQYATTPVADADEYIWRFPSGWDVVTNEHNVDIKFSNAQGGTLELIIVRCGDSSDVIQLPITVIESAEPIIQVDKDVLSVTPSFANYQWCLNGQPIPNATSGTYKVSVNGVYTVIVSNDPNCVDTSADYVISNLSIGRHSLSSVRLYPNPVQQGVLHVVAAEPVDLAIYSIEGRWIKTCVNATEVDTRDMINGQYIVYLTNKEGVTIQVSKLQVLRP